MNDKNEVLGRVLCGQYLRWMCCWSGKSWHEGGMELKIFMHRNML